ncbi:MAG TPA: hypothetical protein VFM14_14805 [Gemmatimonadales bacterium]|nr:hypothetical protein [Gemmatimonadales bacterium]
MTGPPRDPVPPAAERSGLPGLLRLMAALAIALLAVLAALVVLDVVPRELLTQWSVKVILLTGIAALASMAITFILGWGGRRSP